MEGKTPYLLHNNLIKEGFTWKAVPLEAEQNTPQKCWKVNGDKTANGKYPHIVKMHIYTHPDGAVDKL